MRAFQMRATMSFHGWPQAAGPEERIYPPSMLAAGWIPSAEWAERRARRLGNKFQELEFYSRDTYS